MSEPTNIWNRVQTRNSQSQDALISSHCYRIVSLILNLVYCCNSFPKFTWQYLCQYYRLDFLKQTMHNVALSDGSVATVPIFDVKETLLAFLNDPNRMRVKNIAPNYDPFTGFHTQLGQKLIATYRAVLINSYKECLKLYLSFDRWVNDPQTRREVQNSARLLGELITLIKLCFLLTDVSQFSILEAPDQDLPPIFFFRIF